MAEISIIEDEDLQAMKDDFVTAVQRLQAIEDNGSGYNNAQALQAIIDEAIIVKKLLKGLKRLFT